MAQRRSGVTAQGGERLAQRDEVPVDDTRVGSAGAHGRPLPEANRRAASILSSWGRKSK